MIIFPDKKRASEYGRRGTARRQGHIYCIEGEFLTLEQIRQRTKMQTCGSVRDKIRKLDAPITWDKLR